MKCSTRGTSTRRSAFTAASCRCAQIRTCRIAAALSALLWLPLAASPSSACMSGSISAIVSADSHDVRTAESALRGGGGSV